MKILVSRPPALPPEPNMARVGVVIPAYNEERLVGSTVRATLATGAGRVVCVNDGSRDSTGAVIDELAADPRVAAVHHAANRGKQGAVKTGLGAVLSHPEVEVIAVLDADMQHDPALLPRLSPFVGAYDVVVGARDRSEMPGIRRLANALANLPYRILAGLDISDVQSGYRLHSRPVARCLADRMSESGRYALEHSALLLFGNLARQWGRDFRIAEVTVPCTYGQATSNIRVRDDVQLTWAALRHAAALGWLRT